MAEPILETYAPFLAGQAAVVTGASRGIGRAIAVTLARLGADVGLLQRSDAAETRAAVEEQGRRATVVRVDLGDAEAAEAAVDRAAGELGRLDVCVANHGVVRRQLALEVSLPDFRRVIDVNLIGAFAVTRAAARRFAEQGEGRIVHLGSQLSFFGGLDVAAYSASKGAIAQLTKS
jgi:2-deoxy-D-gluconate 3-dehydrogenase